MLKISVFTPIKQATWILISLICFASPALSQQSSEKPTKLDWIDLIPENEQEKFKALASQEVNHTGPAAQQSQVGQTRPELNDTYVKIPGFVIPIEGTVDSVTEFLLVPYFGACIHVPPPPPNQVVYVKFPKGAAIAELWDIVYVVGKLQTDVQEHDLAQTGYTLEGDYLEPYDEE